MNLCLVIVGGGLVGMVVVIELVRCGVFCVFFDEVLCFGGVVYCGFLWVGVDLVYFGVCYIWMLEKLWCDFFVCVGYIDLCLNSCVVGGDGQCLMVFDEVEWLYEVEYLYLFLVIGCYECSVLFFGWILFGVMFFGGL